MHKYIPEREVDKRSIVDEISVFLNTLRIFPFVFLLESEKKKHFSVYQMMIHSAIWSEQGIYYVYNESQKKIYIPQTKETGESNQQIFFLSFSIQLVYVRYNYKRVKNPLFLQLNRSFDFGIQSLYQYTVSFTHSIHNIPFQSIIKNN